MTAQLLVFSALLSFFLGTVFGVLTCKRFNIPVVSKCADFFTFVLRGVPFFVQLLIVYFVIPNLIGIELEQFNASVLSLGICSSGYVAQIMRGGINGIPSAQWESAFALGFSKKQSFLNVVFPQLFRHVIPMLNNELDALLKSTSIVSSIGMLELTRIGMNIVSREMRPGVVYLSVALFYLSMSAILNTTTRLIEKRYVYARSE